MGRGPFHQGLTLLSGDSDTKTVIFLAGSLRGYYTDQRARLSYGSLPLLKPDIKGLYVGLKEGAWGYKTKVII